ncbi:MAG: ribulose-phosphate 3-epimerase [Baekduia sp.]
MTDAPRGPLIAPSILGADFARLGEQVGAVVDAGAQVIHIDVMDGQFVPPLSMGPPVVKALKALDLGVHLDVHLMVDRPERQIADFADAGADTITIHAEATPHVHHALAAIRDRGLRAGLALCPGTPPAVVEEVADQLDLLLCMSVNPGWGGQKFIPAAIEKLEVLRALVSQEVVIEVDGGIDLETAGAAAEAGAGWLVAGSAVYGSDDVAGRFAALTAAVS